MSDDNPLEINRRQFVIAGSAGLVGLSLIAPDVGADTVPLVGSIGYWLGSEIVSDLGLCRNGQVDDLWFDVIPATAIARSDPRFIGTGMRVSIWAMRGEDALGATRFVSLTSEVRAEGLTKPLPFHVWSLERGPVRKESQAVGFNATVEFGRPVDLLVSLGTGARTRAVRMSEGPTADVRFRFALEDGPDARIVRGVYFLGFGAAPIDWNRLEYKAVRREDPTRLLVEKTLGGLRPVGFTYFVVAVDHGTFFENGA
jgi:hypothetical protein